MQTAACDAVEDLGPLEGATGRVAADLEARTRPNGSCPRDHTLWQDDPTEVADRLGWLDCPAAMRAEVPRLLEFADECGGRRPRAGRRARHGRLVAVPRGARPHLRQPPRPAADRRCSTPPILRPSPAWPTDWPLARTLFLAASKSGTTIETRSHLEHFWAEHPDPACFAATTDPGSALAELAAERSFRATFENPPDIGGRYSALSLFGSCPAALAGVLARRPARRRRRRRSPIWPPAARLAARARRPARRTGRDKLTFVLDPRIASFGLWVEQLIAESTGKHGTGVAAGRRRAARRPPDVYGDDRLFVAIGDLGDDDGRGARRARRRRPSRRARPVRRRRAPTSSATSAPRWLLWEAATALCGAAARHQPLRPARRRRGQGRDAAGARRRQRSPRCPMQPVAAVLGGVRPGDYVGIQAYVDPGGGAVDELERIRVAIRDRLAVATTVGLGPRFLHSTGQLHKGGPPTGVFLQVVVDDGDRRRRRRSPARPSGSPR